MALSEAFLDELRGRVSLSGVIARAVKLTRAGREFKACCPFHGEKTPSFTVNDDKGFYHCFGCGAHGDVFRWMQDHDGVPFMDAVRELAEGAGLDLPAPSPGAAARAAQVETVRGAIAAAQAIFVRQLDQAGAVMEYLAARGIGPDEIARFGLGYARGGDGSLRGSGIGQAVGQAAGLLVQREDAAGGMVLRELLWDRITVPIHDHRGQLIGFAGRVHPARRSQEPKFVNSPDGPLFNKGAVLFNLHRAADFLRASRRGDPTNVRPAGSMPEVARLLVIVEGQLDVVALDRAGIGAAVAPGGTALTLRQLERAWRVHHRPTLLFDGDAAGQKAALRACRTAMPMLGPGREIAVAMLPAGQDPDDLVRAGQAGVIEAALLEALPLATFVFDVVVRAAAPGPENIAGIWAELSELAGAIGDDETRAQYVGQWRARFDRECSALPVAAADQALHAVQWTADGDYAFPESESDSARRLIEIVRAKLRKRAEIAAIREELKDIDHMAKAIGFDTKQLNAVVREIESDLAHGPAVREEGEMQRVLYRRTLGISGPMDEAMLPRLVEHRTRAPSAQVKRRAAQDALIDARAVQV